MLLRATLTLTLLLAACGPKPVSLEDYNTVVVTLPDSFKVRCEVMSLPEDMMRGMMFRDSLAEDRGMLFFHGGPGRYPYWMYQTRITLDIIWLDNNQRIVEMSPNTPPCPSKSAKECPSYGGNADATVVLETAAGSIKKHGLRVGQQLRF